MARALALLLLLSSACAARSARPAAPPPPTPEPQLAAKPAPKPPKVVSVGFTVRGAPNGTRVTVRASAMWRWGKVRETVDLGILAGGCLDEVESVPPVLARLECRDLWADRRDVVVVERARADQLVVRHVTYPAPEEGAPAGRQVAAIAIPADAEVVVRRHAPPEVQVPRLGDPF